MNNKIDLLIEELEKRSRYFEIELSSAKKEGDKYQEGLYRGSIITLDEVISLIEKTFKE